MNDGTHSQPSARSLKRQVLAGGAELAFVVFLVLAGLRLTRSLWSDMDILLFDETRYLTSGVRLARQGLPTPDWAPLYAVWYYLLHLLQDDPVRLYYLNYRVVTALLPVAFYAFVRNATGRAWSACLGSFWVLLAFGNLNAWPKPAHAAATLMLCALGIACRVRSWSARFAIVTGAAMLAVYFRPEYSYAVLALLVAWTCHALMRDREWNRAGILGASGVVSTGVVLVLVFGNPLGGGRSWMAFRQHFGLNYSAWHQLSGNPWHHSTQAVKDAFPGARSIGDALRRNPRLFGTHVAQNAVSSVRSVFENAFIHYNVILPATRREGVLYEALTALGILAALALFALWRSRHRLWQRLHDWRSLLRNEWLAITACLVVPGCIAAVIIFPRVHYLLFPVLVMLGWVFVFLGRTLFARWRDPIVLVVAGPLVLLATPDISNGWWYTRGSGRTKTSMPIRERIGNYQKLQVRKDVAVRVLDPEENHAVYFGDNVESFPLDQQMDIPEFMQKHDINLVLATVGLKSLPPAQVAQIEEWLKSPGKFGYRYLGKLSPECPVLARPEILESPTKEPGSLSD